MNKEILDDIYGHLIELEVLVSDVNDCLAKNDDLEMLDLLAEIKRVAGWMYSAVSGR